MVSYCANICPTRPWTKWIDRPDFSNFTQLQQNTPIQVGDRVTYNIWHAIDQRELTHSAIVVEVDSEGYATKVSSKMGIYDVIEHHPRDIPSLYGPMEPTVNIDGVERPSRIYYRPK